MAIGVFCGTLAYRSSYASIFDFRFNHIPLPLAIGRMQFSYYTQVPSQVDVASESTTYSNKLVVWSWWGRIPLGVENTNLKWLRSVANFTQTSANVGKPKSRSPKAGGDFENVSAIENCDYQIPLSVDSPPSSSTLSTGPLQATSPNPCMM